METENDRLIAEQFAKLPPELQSAIKSVPWKSLINEIALLNKLTLGQVSLVEREAQLIIYGFDNPANFINNLVREVKIPEDKAINIAEEMHERVLKRIEQQVEKFAAPPTPPVTPAPQVPEIMPVNLPMVEPLVEVGSKEKEVRKEEQKLPEQAPIVGSAFIPTPPPAPTVEPSKEPISAAKSPQYPGGVDPYREPIE